ncbi:hypothetical protein ACWZHB_12465 [Nocardia sp. FBN12]|uniref:hypothetical protein n=1 Tax=Nocardia sp. FBN12 TaxID=3419766 RepID=UPI003D0559FD
MLIGDTPTARRVAESLAAEGTSVIHLLEPLDVDLRSTLSEKTAMVAVMVHDDIRALRFALGCAHFAPNASILVTIFDRTIGDELHRLLPQCEVTSPADLALPHLVDICVGDARGRRRSLSTAASTVATHLTGFLRTTDVGARTMVYGMAGLGAVVALDLCLMVLGEQRHPARAFYDAVRVVTTVGPAEVPHLPVTLVLSPILMLITVVFTAMFTAGVVDRSIGPRLLGLVGPRSLPRRDHVVVVGLGQVGARLCIELHSNECAGPRGGARSGGARPAGHRRPADPHHRRARN